VSWWQALHIALSISLFVALFIVGDDEPFVSRVVGAGLVALLWLPGLILLAVVMLIDAGMAAARSLRK
jgi:hypothetical protein